MPAMPRDATKLLLPGTDPAWAETTVQEDWVQGLSADAIAGKYGLPIAYSQLVIIRVRAMFRDIGIDWKRERAEKLLALNQELRNRLLDRIRTAHEGKFSIHDVKELRELMLLEMKQLGLLAPERFEQVGSGKTYDELVELCKQAGIPVPGDHYGPDEPSPLPRLPSVGLG
ncbi:MAG: hypothetical protein U0871_02010 [Gemmataceae bacterium]